ncbi:hypothetical protein LOTGIDRAFT_126693 [Lottia gigantea]|uniref:Peptidase M60 domain-containing protein n=1 Tax=Lottia gigantea TaxID=225164 RepID=V4BHI6_LOTGI|nr:hypothetical protein LOTGIDRAFT_126693 [Lottia gigantea]ESO88164.1 hypothetical protein LOTGIDRAFT_126693 [Lottia gigantea]
MSQLEDVYPTGCYLKAGDEAIVTIQTEEALKYGWRLQIGCHTDRLHTVDNHIRWPYLTETVPVDRRRFKITSLYGGLIYFISPGRRCALEAVLSNVVEAPFFDLTNRARVDGWKERRYAPGLWADICGQFIIITLPSKNIRHIDDLTEVMRAWDEVVRANHHLRGSNIHRYRRQWIVTDVQPLGGAMHAGYPIVTGLDLTIATNKSFLLNYNQIIDGGFWNVFSEIGHNMQKSAWTFKGTENVTNDIFTLYVYDIVCRIGPWMPERLLSRIKYVKRYLDRDEGFFEWLTEPSLALFIYAQLANHFGWGLYKSIFRKYRLMNQSAIPHHNVTKIDFWFTSLSEIAGYNLAPLCDFWRIPLSTAVRNHLTQFPPFLPDDEVTRLAPQRVREICEFYHGVIMTSPRKVEDNFKDDFEQPRFQQPAVMTHIMRS